MRITATLHSFYNYVQAENRRNKKAAYLTAATVKGWVKDAQTGEELIGAAVYVKENPAMGTTAGLDGTFVLKDVPEGKNITLVCSYISYETKSEIKRVVIASLFVFLFRRKSRRCG